MTQPDPPNHADADDAGASTQTPPPRAFAQGTGVLLQVVGMVLFLASCCVCSVAGKWDNVLGPQQAAREVAQNPGVIVTLGNLFRDPGRTGLMLLVVGSTVAGLGMAVCGLGLQSDKRRAAWAALAATSLWLTSLIGAIVCLWIGDAAWIVRILNVLLILAAAVLVGFCVAALRQVRANPPPPGLEVLPADFEIPRGFRH